MHEQKLAKFSSYLTVFPSDFHNIFRKPFLTFTEFNEKWQDFTIVHNSLLDFMKLMTFHEILVV